MITVLLEHFRRRLVLLPNPASSAEELMTVGPEPAHFVCGWLIADDTDEDDAEESPQWVLRGYNENPREPQPQQLVYGDTHKPLDLIRVLLLRTRHDTSEYEI